VKKVLVCGAGGFIGGHMVKRLKELGYWVRGVDIKKHLFLPVDETCDEFCLGDLRDSDFVKQVCKGIDYVYQFAADMGGAGFIFTGKNDANIMYNSAMINLNVLDESLKNNVKRIFFSSSACIYPEHNQMDSNNPNCEESSAYPAAPDSEYGWEKLFSERLYLAHKKNHNLDVRVARYHNIFGPYGVYDGGREKAPAAFCRKVSEAEDKTSIEVWGDGSQTRSFLFIDDCIDATYRLMNSDFVGPVNIGSEEIISIQNLAKKVIKISNKNIKIKNIEGPLGVMGRNSHNKLIKEKLGWEPSVSLDEGLKRTFAWIDKNRQEKK